MMENWYAVSRPRRRLRERFRRREMVCVLAIAIGAVVLVGWSLQGILPLR